MNYYYITAESLNREKLYATYDPVFDSLMILGKSKDIVKFDSFSAAKIAINSYQCFQRGLNNWKVEKI